MFPNRPTAPSLAKGAALPIALFIIVVMALVGAALVRLTTDASQGVVHEVIGQRAYNAARSGAEIFLVQLFAHDSNVNETLCQARDPGVLPSQNPDVSPHLNQFTTPGLTDCSAKVFCDVAEIESTTHFRIVSQGSCDAGGMIYTKELLLEASDLVL